MMIKKVLAGEMFSSIETLRYNKKGEIIPVSVSGAIYKDKNGNPIGSVINLRDISHQKKLEAQLQQAQKMEAIGTLAGGIAHDFNNILSSVIGYTELALDNEKRGTFQHKNLQQILYSGNRAKDLVKQILTFSRQVDQKQKPIQVKPIVKEVLKMLRATIPSTVEIEQIVQSNALVMGDPTQIHQILMNLCANAAHAMEDNGGLLTVRLLDAELDSDFISNHPDLKPGPYINLTVTDTGHGISPDVVKKIFDPFFTTKEKGTGMGLSVVHGIVRSHGGDIYVYSEPGKGSTFKVCLPVIESRFKPEERAESPIPKGTERILFIDDEPAIMKLGKQTLESLGYDVVARNSSIEALELFKKKKDRFDLVITDMTMPNMTGEKLSEKLMQIRPDIPVILCTGFSSMIDEQKALDMGIRAFISKPILKREIAEAIRKVLDES
jgi:nitrogen-specific signal transduction histidine kinase/ActR/RegA family two-component response regulator